jgi:recombination protein RecA
MAKKKEDVTEEIIDAKTKKGKDKALSLEAFITKEFGDNVMVGGNHIVDKKLVIIPVSPSIDILLSGGINTGTFVVISGKPKLGKTTMALQFAANAQNIKYKDEFNPNGRTIYYSNVEARIKPRDLSGIHNLDTSEDRFKIIQSTPGKILTGEDHLNIAEYIINTKPGSIIIIDSFSAMCTAAGFAANLEDQVRDDSTRLLGRFCRRNATAISLNNCVVIGIVHVIANQEGGPMSPKWVEASGNKIQYQADVKLKGDYFQAWKDGEVQIGQDVHWSCGCSSLGSPGGKCVSKLRYGYGLDKEFEVIELAIDLGLIKQGGAWYTINHDYKGFKDQKVQGKESLRTILVNNPDLYVDLYAKVREMLGLQPV